MTSDYILFMAFRIVQAIGCGCFVLSQALVQDLFDGRERDRLRILMVTATGIFISLSPLAGSFCKRPGLARQLLAVHRPGGCGVAQGLAVSRRWSTRRQRYTAQFPQRLSTGARGFRVRRLLADFGFRIRLPLLVHRHFAADLHGSVAAVSLRLSLILLIYGAAYVTGGIAAALLSRRISSAQQIVAGLSLILLAGWWMLFWRATCARPPRY
jgi:DHA1 family bicyclomycin/chloramphenicol resistance-like MFS transporter